MHQPTLRLAHKVAIITGAGCVGPGWGNGRATAVRFAQEGAKVFAVDIHLDAMAETQKMISEFGRAKSAQLFRLTITMMVTMMPTMTEKNAMPTA